MSIDVNEHYDKIYRYCYFKLKNQQQAEDVTQEAFLRFLESSHYKDDGRPLAYLYTIAKNLCMDEFRRIKTEELQEEVEQAGFEDTIIERENLRVALASLTKEEEELLLLRYVNELPFSDLCRLYGKSRFALYRELTAITKKLERRLSDGT